MEIMGLSVLEMIFIIVMFYALLSFKLPDTLNNKKVNYHNKKSQLAIYLSSFSVAVTGIIMMINAEFLSYYQIFGAFFLTAGVILVLSLFFKLKEQEPHSY